MTKEEITSILTTMLNDHAERVTRSVAAGMGELLVGINQRQENGLLKAQEAADRGVRDRLRPHVAAQLMSIITTHVLQASPPDAFMAGVSGALERSATLAVHGADALLRALDRGSDAS